MGREEELAPEADVERLATAEVRGVAAHDLEPVRDTERVGPPPSFGRKVLGQLDTHRSHRRKRLEHREHSPCDAAAKLEQDTSGRERGDIRIGAELRPERVDEAGRERVGRDRAGEDQPVTGGKVPVASSSCDVAQHPSLDLCRGQGVGQADERAGGHQRLPRRGQLVPVPGDLHDLVDDERVQQRAGALLMKTGARGQLIERDGLGQRSQHAGRVGAQQDVDQSVRSEDRGEHVVVGLEPGRRCHGATIAERPCVADPF